MSTPRIGLIGCGAMGTAMLSALLRAYPSADTLLCDSHTPYAETAAQAHGGQVAAVVEAAGADIVLLAVKPGTAPGLLPQLSAAHGAVLSVVTGLTLAQMRAEIPDATLIRTMPNLAVASGQGVTAYAVDGPETQDWGSVADLLRECGTAVEIAEELFSAATAVIGSGPGFMALVAEALEEGAVSVGFSRDDARKLIPGVLGASAALLSGGDDPAAVRQRVSSPARTTIAGLGVLERGAVRAHIADAVRTAAERAAQLSS